MQSTSSPSSLRPKEEEAYVKSLLEMSRSRRRKKKEELKELQNSLFHFNDDGNNQEYEEINPARSSSSSRSRSTSPSFRGNNSSGNWTGTNNIHSSSPEQQQHYTTPTICSEVRRVATNYAHEQHKQLSDDIRASYLLKRMEELKRMNIKAMIDHSFNSSSCVTKDQSQQVYLSNITSPTSPTKSFPTNVNTPLSPHSKQYELERRKRVEARQEKLKNSPNTLEENYLAVSQQSPPQKLKRPSSARPTTQSQPQFQPNPNLIRSPEKFQTSQNSILNNSSRKHSQHAPDLSKTPDKLTSPTKVQRPSSAPKSRVVQSVETPKKTVPYNQRRVVKPPLDPFEKEEKIILDQIQDLDDQLQKSVVFRSVVSSISDLPQKTVKPKETDLNNSIVSNRVSRPTTPSSSRKSNTRSPSSYSRCSNRPQSFETPKENSLEEIAKKNRERYGHIKPKVVSRRAEYSGSEQMATPSQNRNQRPSSALSGRVSNSGLGIKQFDDVSFSSTPKRPSSLPRKNRNENTRDLNDVRSVNISLKNILLEQEEYKRVWGEIEEEELRILKFTPKASQNSKSEKPEKDTNISDANEKYNSFTKLDFDDNSESNFKSVMRKRIEEIEMGLKKIASLDPNETRDGDIVKHEESFDNNQTQDMESHYRILFDSKDNHQSSYPSESSQLIEIDLEQSKISSCGEEDTTTIIEERVSNNIDAFLSHGESDNRESPKVNESMLSSSFIGDTSQIPSNPEFRKFINDKLDMLEKECSLHQ